MTWTLTEDEPWPPPASVVVVGQSKRHSVFEAVTNIVVGFGIAVAAQMVVFPWFGMTTSWLESAEIGLPMTAVSLVRSYVLRRIFNELHRRQHA